MIAGQAVSYRVVGGALVRNGNAGFIGIEDPSIGASKANLVVPVPGSAT